MKRTGNIYEKVCDLENIKLAIRKASLGKRQQSRVAHVLRNIDRLAPKIQAMLLDKTYIPSPYIIRTIEDGANKKTRTIHKPRFYPDQIIHWALMLQLTPVIMRGMYQYNCGSIPGRGTAYGQKSLRKWLDTDVKNTKYCLKMDITKFYPSVNADVLKGMFQRKLKDKDALWLIDVILDSSEGLPIGDFTSQWFSNFFLEGLDHYIKQVLGIKYYVRYVDDLVLLGPNKKKLHAARKDVEQYLGAIKLRLKGNWQVFKVSARAIDFLGFRFFRDKTILRKRNVLRIRRRCKKIAKKRFVTFRDACAIVSYWGWIKRSNSYNFYNKHVKPIVSLNIARKVVSNYARTNPVRE